MRLAICLLILLILISQWFEIDFILGPFVAGAVVRAALPEYELKATAVRRNWLRFLCAAPRNRTLEQPCGLDHGRSLRAVDADCARRASADPIKPRPYGKTIRGVGPAF